MNVEAQTETLSFQAEVKQLLHLVAHSLYSNQEIFLRELISNSSDAADKLRYQALTDSALYEKDPELKIWVSIDEKHKLITIRDNGIGMNRDDIIQNLGTIAQSGTRAFKQLLEADKAKDSQLIGQFGVGFYSAFVVADKVTVRSRKAGMNANQGVQWESDGQGEYTVKNIDMAQRGTEVVLHMKDECKEFLDAFRVRQIIRKYSDHILLPIMMIKPESADDKEDKKDKKTQATPEWEVVNQANALWTLPKSDITKEQYIDLYKHIAHDFEDPLDWSHNRVEGKHEYISLLYIPKRAPFDLWQRDFQRGIKLYVKHVFIMDKAEELLPQYLRFVKGVVDANDLPLNVSREILQSNQTIDSIRSGCVKRILDMLEKMANNEPKSYQEFWDQFGQVLKEGPGEDFANKDRIAKLLRFASTHQDSATQNISLSDYLGRMQSDQDKIYYLTADNYQAAKNSPLLEVFRKKNIEVLLLTDRVDEWLVSHLPEFDGKKLQSVAKGEVKIGDEKEQEATKQTKEKQEKEYKKFLEQLQKNLGERVKAVRLSERLVDSPACVVFDENEMSGHLQRLLEAAGQAITKPTPILEVNVEHPLIKKVHAETDDERFKEWAEVLLGQALIAEGEQLQDAADFVKRLNRLLL